MLVTSRVVIVYRYLTLISLFIVIVEYAFRSEPITCSSL